MLDDIIFVGAGPIGLWTAIQIKLQNPAINIILKEKKDTYKRTHTLLLKPTSFKACLKDEDGVIQGIIHELEKNPHIRTNELEQRLKALALALGIKIERQDVQRIHEDIIDNHPNAAMIIGSDGVKSQVRTQMFAAGNTERVALAYAAQIKYSVSGQALAEDQLFATYPLLKQSNYLASVNVGKLKDGKTPVTIQIVIDKATYENIKHATYANPIRLLADSLEEQLPPELLNDVKTHIGFRLHNKENIIINDINLTASELPQQRCKQVTTVRDGHYYGVIGDAALALSYFKGMNTGLQLATKFAKAIVSNWKGVVAKDPAAFDDYKITYDQFATAAFKSGHETNRFIGKVQSAIHASAALPFQFIYFDNNTISDFHRCFDIYNQTCQFYIEAQMAENPEENHITDAVIPSAHHIKGWLGLQMDAGLNHLICALSNHASNYQASYPSLSKSLRDLSSLDHDKLDVYNKAYWGLAMSKINTLLAQPTPENYQACLKLANRLKPVNSGFMLIISSMVELVLGVIALSVGIAALVCTAGAAAPYAVPFVGIGSLLTGHGIYKLQKNLQGPSAMYRLLEKVITERLKLDDGQALIAPVSAQVVSEDLVVEEIDEHGYIDVPLESEDEDEVFYRGPSGTTKF
jgi:2-polyprenyl-6-methoxyphenol hydroxylase-like FAD-dependent oxidoreductase